MTTETTTAAGDLKRAVDYLAGRCDFAVEDDGQGFNSSDTAFGHVLADAAAEDWTADDRIAARVMLQKYVGQLEAIDIDPRELPREDVLVSLTAEERIAREQAAIKVARHGRAAERAAKKASDKRIAERAAKHLITLEGSEFVVAFPYHREMVADCKAIPGRKRFQGAPPAWRLRVDDVDPQRLVDFLRKYHFAEPEPVRAKLVELIQHPRPRLSGPSAINQSARTIALGPDRQVVELRYPFSQAINEQLAATVPTARWDKVARCWTVPLRAASVEGLGRFLTERAASHGFVVSEEVAAIVAKVVGDQREAIEMSRAAVADPAFVARVRAAVPDGLMPFDFQVAGIRYALDAKRVIIGDEMGLGKTIQAIVTAMLGDAWPLVVVCPATLIYNWYRELKKWAPRRTVSVLQAGRPGAYHADVVIINYDILTVRAAKGEKREKRKKGSRLTAAAVPLSRHARAILDELKPRGIVFDEVHYLKNHKALRTQAATLLARECEYRLGLSGTAILNRPSELIAPLSALGRLADLGGFNYFARRYCGGGTSYGGGVDLTGASHLDELNTKLRACCYIRREKSQVLAELPAKVRQVVTFPIANRPAYLAAARDVSKWFGQMAVSNGRFLAKLDAELDARARRLRLDGLAEPEVGRQVAAERLERLEKREADAVDSAKKAEALLKLEALKRLAVEGKLDAAIEWIGEFVAEQKLIVFAHHIDVQQRIAAAFPGCAHLFGSDDTTARDAAVQRFQTDPSCRLIVASLSAAGVGWTGTAASNVAFVELAWRPGDHDQAEDRAHRIGQRDSVTAWYLTAEDTIEQPIATLLESKRAIVEAALIGGGNMARLSILTELIAGLDGLQTTDTAAPEGLVF